MALTTINSDGVKDDSIVNADIKSDAAIAGTKIAPDFGSQNIATTGNINIGAGTGRLDSSGIIKTSNGTEAAPSHTFINDPDNGMLRSASNEIAFSTGGSTALTINSSQKVGIGTVSPANLLSLEDSAPVLSIKDTASYTAYTNGGKIYFQGTDSDGSANKTFAGIKGVSQSSNNGQLRLQSRNSGTLYDRLTIDAVGKIGLYTITSPVATLHQKSHSNGWEGGILLEEQNATTGWAIHPDNSDELMIGRNTDTSSSSSTHIASFTTDGLKLASGKGINFSAYATSGNPSSNLLDDYEEGSWGSVAQGGATCDFTDNWYIKVGKKVTCNVKLSNFGGTGQSGVTWKLTLPFAAVNEQSIGSMAANDFNLESDWVWVTPYVYGAHMYFLATRDNAGWESVKGNGFANSSIILTVTYEATS